MENEANRYVSEIHDSAKNTVSALRHEAIGAVQREANAALYVKAEAASTAASYNSAFQREVETNVALRGEANAAFRTESEQLRKAQQEAWLEMQAVQRLKGELDTAREVGSLAGVERNLVREEVAQEKIAQHETRIDYEREYLAMRNDMIAQQVRAEEMRAEHAQVERKAQQALEYAQQELAQREKAEQHVSFLKDEMISDAVLEKTREVTNRVNAANLATECQKQERLAPERLTANAALYAGI